MTTAESRRFEHAKHMAKMRNFPGRKSGIDMGIYNRQWVCP